MKQKLMILGAGIFQVPLIEKAKTMGLEAIVVSPYGSYPGIPLADIHLALDTTDKVQIVAAAKKYKIDGIVTTGTDVSVPSLGAVADELGLIGPSRQIAELVSHKTSFRTFLSDKQLNCPDFAICHTLEDVFSFCCKYPGKSVFKPDDSSGSRGVVILPEKVSKSEIEKAYQHALQFSKSGLVCAESFLEGREVGGDAFFIDGSLEFFVTTCKHMKGVLVQGHSLPGDLTDEQINLIRLELSSVAQKLGYTNGPMNFDAMVNNKHITLLEVALRGGGNGMQNCIHRYCGADLAEWLIKLALGNKKSHYVCTDRKPVSSYVFGSQSPGILKNISSFAELQKNIPEVKELILSKNLGDKVEIFSNNANLIGYIILACGSDRYSEIIERVKAALCIEVERE